MNLEKTLSGSPANVTEKSHTLSNCLFGDMKATLTNTKRYRNENEILRGVCGIEMPKLAIRRIL